MLPFNRAGCMSTPGGGVAITPETANLFEAYVQGFCALGEE